MRNGIICVMKMRMILAVGVLSMVFAGFARTFEVAAWRGETVAARVPDFAEIGKAPEGFSVRYGVLKSVKYAPKVEDLQRLEVYDRVKWGLEGEEGPRVVEVRVPENAKPGVYACGSMRIRVVDRVLPPAKDWKYFLDLWQHPWAVARMAKVKPFSKAHYAAMRPLWKELATAGQKVLTVTLVDQPWDHQCYDAYGSMIGRVKKADGSWAFDYSIFDEYVEFGRKCGLGPDIACYTMCPWGYVCCYQDESGKTISVTCNPGTPQFEDFWGAFLVDFAAHLKSKGWFNDTYIAMDERSPEDVSEIATFIQSKAPGMRVAMAGNRSPADFKGITIDNYSQILGHVSTNFLAEVKERRAQGYKTTYYICCWPIYPNTFMSSGAGEAFWLGAFPGVCGLDGFLRWAWNSWPQNPEKDATFGTWASGDTFLVYPDGSPSWRFLELRNGIIAAEKLNILREQNVRTAEIEQLSSLYVEKEAMANCSNFVNIRAKTLGVVNK